MAAIDGSQYDERGNLDGTLGGNSPTASQVDFISDNDEGSASKGIPILKTS